MSINLLLPNEDEAVIWRRPLVGGASRQFWGDVVWGDLDVLVVDLPPGTSDASLTVMQSIPLNGVVLVTSPQDLAGMVARIDPPLRRGGDRGLLGGSVRAHRRGHCGASIRAAEHAYSLDRRAEVAMSATLSAGASQ